MRKSWINSIAGSNKFLNVKFFLAYIFIASLVYPAVASSICNESKRKYLSEGNIEGTSEVFLLPITSDSSKAREIISKADVIRTYRSIAASRKPDFTCKMYGQNGQEGYEDINCTLTANGKTFNPWGGQGIEIEDDGNTRMHGCWKSATKPCIEDLEGRRIYVDSYFVWRPYAGRDYYNSPIAVISDCDTGVIDIVTLEFAFKGYAILVRSKQTGFVSTYTGAPSLRF